MSGIEDKRPTLRMKWEVLDKNGGGTRALVFTSVKSKHLSPAASRPVNAIGVGDELRLVLQSDMDGYLHFFDFGTSGAVTKIFPSAQLSQVDNRIEAGRTYSAPGELLRFHFTVSGPTTAESGRKERLLVVVTRRQMDLSLAAVESAGAAFATRGGFASVDEAVATLTDLPEDEWTYGLLETEVNRG